MQWEVPERLKAEDTLYSTHVHVWAHFEDRGKGYLPACFEQRLDLKLCYAKHWKLQWAQYSFQPPFTYTDVHTHTLIQLDMVASLATLLSHSTNIFEGLLHARHGFKDQRLNAGHKIPPSVEFII